MLLLSCPSEDKLGSLEEKYFVEEAPLAAIAQLQSQLQDFEADLDRRNNDRLVPYKYMRPSEVPNSTAI